MVTIINPFRYTPDERVLKAADVLISKIAQSELHQYFNEGKMLGVMIVKLNNDVTSSKELHSLDDFHYIAAFSGCVGGKNFLPGFVPPIYNLLDKEGYFKTEEVEISKINKQIEKLESSNDLKILKEKLLKTQEEFEEQSEKIRFQMTESRKEREKLRAGCTDSVILAKLITESQTEKANFRRFKKEAIGNINVLASEIQSLELEINVLKIKRARMSDKLQNWIFKQYIVHNFQGEEKNIYDIFRKRNLVPPGGSGDCAGVKLFEYAILRGLEPLAMGEFWYGVSPEGPVRNHGDFYPACSSKCGIILPWMMKGLCQNDDIIEEEAFTTNDILLEDEYLIVVDKKSGIPSVPGLDGRKSLIETLEEYLETKLFVVHRLDMDTSGLIVYAKNQEVASALQAQFENRTVNKAYKARLRPPTKYDVARTFQAGEKGKILLPLSPIYEDRPRQMVDFKNGKEAITEYEIEKINDDGSIDVIFRPITGRTHQLRVHAAHHLGLGRPILGDKLYGGARSEGPLHLTAIALTLYHPLTNKTISLRRLLYHNGYETAGAGELTASWL